MATKPNIAPELLRQLLSYDPKTGRLTWRERDLSLFPNPGWGQRWNARYAGTPAGDTIDGKGYRVIKLFNKQYLAHRVCWAIHYGAWPTQIVDHRNHDRSNNRIRNLRACSRSVNQRNQSDHGRNTSGHIGVTFNKGANKWAAFIRINGKQKHLGFFVDIADAAASRKAAERKLGYHRNHGK